MNIMVIHDLDLVVLRKQICSLPRRTRYSRESPKPFLRAFLEINPLETARDAVVSWCTFESSLPLNHRLSPRGPSNPYPSGVVALLYHVRTPTANQV